MERRLSNRLYRQNATEYVVFGDDMDLANTWIRVCGGRMKYVALFTGCLAKIIAGSIFVFNVYAGALKKNFNFTEKELVLQSSMYSVGTGLAFIPGMFYERFGSVRTLFLSLLIPVASYTLLWSTTKAVHFYSPNSWLMAVYFFLAGFGSVFLYIMALIVNLSNFNKQHRGKITGILNTCFAGSPLLFSPLYYHVLDRGNPNSLQAFADLMLLYIIMFAVIGILCLLFLRTYNEITNQETKLDENVESIREDNMEGFSDEISNGTECSRIYRRELNFNTLELNHPQSIKEIVKDVNFQLLLWICTISAGVGVFISFNLTEFTSALHLQTYDSSLVLIIPLMATVLSAIIGLISDKLLHVVSRDKMLLSGVICVIISEIVYICVAYIIEWLMFATVMMGLGLALVWSIGPTLMSEIHHVDNIGRNWGFVVFFIGILSFIVQFIYGALYDAAIKTPGERYCYGMKCLQGAIGLCIAITSLAMVLCVTFIVRNRNRLEDERIPLTK